MADRIAALRKMLDAARVALAALVGVVALVASSGAVLGLPPGVTAGAATLVTLAGQWGIRAKTTPHGDPDPSQIPELADTPEFADVAAEPEQPPSSPVTDAVAADVPAIAQAPPRGELEEPRPPAD